MRNVIDLDQLDQLDLEHGSHTGPADGACLLEAVSYIAGEPWTDHPACVSPVLAAYGRRLNDALDDDTRQQLKQYIPDLIGTRTDDRLLDDARAAIAGDWAIAANKFEARWADVTRANQADAIELFGQMIAARPVPASA